MEFIAGVDEAGRGPLAGPVVAAAVILNPDKPILGLNDSKKLTEKKRELLLQSIRENALAIGVAFARPREIDDINILQASLLAMSRAVAKLRIQPTLALIDGNKCPELLVPAKAIIGGDALEPAISAASIVAKVLRDRFMLRLDTKYPEYQFAKHKGYPTKVHIAALREFGPTKAHRLTFGPVAKCTDVSVG